MAKSRKRGGVNPRRKPATQADVEKAVKSGVKEAVAGAQAIFFTVLRDKEGYDKEKLQEFWKKVTVLSEEILEGRVSISDLRYVLREEAEIYI